MPFTWRTGRRGLLTAAATACTLTGSALLTLGLTDTATTPPPAPPAAATAPDQPETAAEPAPSSAGLPRSVPVRVTADRVGLAARIEAVGLAGDGSIALPKDADDAGWYTGSVTPGERGNALVVAHVDDTDGPAAFYPLSSLKRGDRIEVNRRDGSTASFTVSGMQVHPRDDFPARVYRPTTRPRLTLITCTGWDPDTRTYQDNLVITAHLTNTAT
ncbi:sortase [Streptomyces sp. DSM 42041]|uniref:Sortase n=1 Tax=Streptomyces hazeniae TaxID=3075538 RepID=A0ABU2P088_9ACTN|nr:sortase [Streptomyces sp. DSM 42041]MDT0382177.1 sortase [Streptomyces sp. DSM 42041]